MTIEELKKAPEGTALIFKGKKFYHLGWDSISDTLGTPLCTEEQFRNFEMFAHIYPNGDIRSFGKVIGNVEEVTIDKEE